MRDFSCYLRHRRVSRRGVFKQTALAFGAAFLPWHTGISQTDRAGGDAMRRRAIPATGETLAVMGLGTSGAFSSYGGTDRRALRAVMRQFVAMGGELVDTSPTYGNAETNIGRIAQKTGVRDALFMATKVHSRGTRPGQAQMAGSRARLGSPIDLMQVHNLIDVDTQWQTLKQMKAAGEVRYIGITHYRTDAFDALERLLRRRDMDFVQLNYSILTPDASRRLLPLAADRGVAVIVNRAFNDGRFFYRVNAQRLPDYAAAFDCQSWAQFALKYVLADPAVTVVIPATSDPEHLMDNMRAGHGALPDTAMQKRMRDTIANLS